MDVDEKVAPTDTDRTIDTYFDHGGQIYQHARDTGLSTHDILDFSANINPLGPPDTVVNALIDALSLIRNYPDPYHVDVKQVIARHFRVHPAQILCGNGASEVIDILVQHLKPERIVVLEPAFSEYRNAALRHGIDIVTVPLFDGDWFDNATETARIPVDKLDMCLQKNDLLFLNSPHNPTGACFSITDWYPYAKHWMERGTSIIVDESFLDFLQHEAGHTAIHHAVGTNRFFVVRSATKFYSIPGIRFGFAIGSQDSIKVIERYRDRWTVNQLAQQAAVVAYQDVAFQQATWRWLRDEQIRLEALWTSLKEVQVHFGRVNYFLIRVLNMDTATKLNDFLQHRHMYIRSCTRFEKLGPTYFRIAIRMPDENQRLFDAVESYFQM